MQDLHQILKTYQQALLNTAQLGKANEHSYRTQLENLLNTLKDPPIRIIQEPKTDEEQSDIRPDFKVYRQIDSTTSLSYNALVGFIECKEWGKKLDIKSKQIEKYLAICPNILLTDYNRFILLSFGNTICDLTLFPYGIDSNLLTHEQESHLHSSLSDFQSLLYDFFNASYATIKSKQELVNILSTQSFYLGLKVRESAHSTPRTSFHRFFENTYETFRNITRYGLSIEEFCDMLGQSVVYGLLVAHINDSTDDATPLKYKNVEDIATLLPKEFHLLSEFIYFSIPSFHIPEPVSYALENIKKTIAIIDKPALATMLNTQIDSISIYLYEDFLQAYDDLRGSEKRKEGGVFYTPEPIINCICSSIHTLLKSDFNKPKGFLDSGVKVLDFATGTGSFLAKVFELILNEEKSRVWKEEAITSKFLQDIYGFELSFVPYIVAHIKLSSILKSKGFHNFNDKNKLQIFLTNTLDLSIQADYQMTMPLLLLEEQDKLARKIKHTNEVLVIVGNPPYYQNSKNNLPEIINLLNSYKPSNEQNIQPLNNDYIKFMRFAQWKLLERYNPSEPAPLLLDSRQGIMGFITPNSYIWGRTHRKMRESLYNAFDMIYIINLHGDNEKDRREDENVFDIRVGVCVSIFIKYPDGHSVLSDKSRKALAETAALTPSKLLASASQSHDFSSQSLECQDSSDMDSSSALKSTSHTANTRIMDSVSPKSQADSSHAKIFYFSTSDNGIFKRADKYALLNSIATNGLDSISWQNLECESPYFWFIKRELDSSEYEEFFALAEDKALGNSKSIFAECNSGIKTSNDDLATQYTKDGVEILLKDITELEIESIATKYKIQNPYKTDWDLRKIKQKIMTDNDKESKIHQIAYRPFDTRYTYYTGEQGFIGRPRFSIMKHFLLGGRQNLGLCFPKTSHNQSFDYGLVLNTLGDVALGGKNSGSETYIAPLYRYEQTIGNDKQTHTLEKIPNFTDSFKAYCQAHTILQAKSPEQILHFIYANLFHPHYRAKYAEYLRIGFPRINFAVSKDTFNALESIGSELIKLHLLREVPQDPSIYLDLRSEQTSSPNFTIEKRNTTKRYLLDDNGEYELVLNDDLCVRGVSPEVYNYTIGGYKVIEKWLSYRADYACKREELEYLESICKILKRTITLQSELEQIALS